MLTEKQKKKFLNILEIETSPRVAFMNNYKALESFKIKCDKVMEGWDKIFKSYPQMLNAEVMVFSDSQKVFEGLSLSMERGAIYLKRAIEFRDNHLQVCKDFSCYMSDQKYLLDEIMAFKDRKSTRL